MEERKKSGSLPFDYTFGKMTQTALSAVERLPHPNSQFTVSTQNEFLWMKDKNYNRTSLSKVKFHFNLDVPESLSTQEKRNLIAKAWDAIMPVLLANPELVMAIKVIDPLKTQAAIQENYENLKSYEKKFTEAKSKFSKEELDFMQQQFKACRDDYKEETARRMGAAITFFISKNKKGQIDIEGYKRIIAKCAAALQDAGIKPGKTPETDFRVSDYTSIRCDELENGLYINQYTTAKIQYRDYFKNNPIIRAFVTPKDLNVVAAFKPEPALLRGSNLGIEHNNMQQYSPEIMAAVEKLFSNTEWIAAVCVNKNYQKLIMEIKKIFSYQQLNDSVRLNVILSLSELLIESLSREQAKHELGLFSGSKINSVLMEEKTSEAQNQFYTLVKMMANFSWQSSPIELIGFINYLSYTTEVKNERSLSEIKAEAASVEPKESKRQAELLSDINIKLKEFAKPSYFNSLVKADKQKALLLCQSYINGSIDKKSFHEQLKLCPNYTKTHQGVTAGLVEQTKEFMNNKPLLESSEESLQSRPRNS